MTSSCYQCVKDTILESNSQQTFVKYCDQLCCYQCVKDTILESNSQLRVQRIEGSKCCYQCVKDTILESNSQLRELPRKYDQVVISVSKIQFLKAIHNCNMGHLVPVLVVISVSKIQFLKAIHNNIKCLEPVVLLLSVCQRYNS